MSSYRYSKQKGLMDNYNYTYEDYLLDDREYREIEYILEKYAKKTDYKDYIEKKYLGDK